MVTPYINDPYDLAKNSNDEWRYISKGTASQGVVYYNIIEDVVYKFTSSPFEVIGTYDIMKAQQNDSSLKKLFPTIYSVEYIGNISLKGTMEGDYVTDKPTWLIKRSWVTMFSENQKEQAKEVIDIILDYYNLNGYFDLSRLIVDRSKNIYDTVYLYDENLAKGGNINWFKSKEGKGDPAITKRNKPNVNALEKYGAGEISYDDYLKISKKETPIKEIDVFYEPATYDEIYNALEKQNQKISTKQGKVPKQDVIDAPIEKGQAIGVRLDIPSYVRYNTWVVSIHDGHKQSGKPISYQAVVRIKDVTFGTIPSFAFLIAIGDVPKNTIGRMYGYYDPIEGETAEERSENTKKLVSEINKDKDWSQVGMNPFRHSYFYLRKNGMPVVSADEVVQIGGLVYAKNAKTVKPDDDEFKIDNSRVKQKYPGVTHFNKGGKNDITDLAYTVAWDCHIGGNRPNIKKVKEDIKKLMLEEDIGMHYLLTNCYDYFEKGGLI